jgi:FKBP-type peptidyl-prolyl cis-trans isomerase
MRFFIFLSFSFLALASCAQQTDKAGGTAAVEATTTPKGFQMYHHTKHGGPTPKPGQITMFKVEVWANKTLLQRSKGSGYRLEMADPAQLQHVPPMLDAAYLMSVGDSATVYQPVDAQMREMLPPDAKTAKEIRFELVLLTIIGEEGKAQMQKAANEYLQQIEQKVRTTAKSYAAGLLKAQIKTTASGLKYYIETKGTGALPKVGEAVSVNYFGALLDGTPFDNSFKTNRPMVFPAGGGQMIPGFDEGSLLLHHGDRAYLFIPAKLGYGAQGSGSIPPNSELLFYIEML